LLSWLRRTWLAPLRSWTDCPFSHKTRLSALAIVAAGVAEEISDAQARW
jgi:hypothetical protein